MGMGIPIPMHTSTPDGIPIPMHTSTPDIWSGCISETTELLQQCLCWDLPGKNWYLFIKQMTNANVIQ